MTIEVLLHINESLSEQQKGNLLISLGNHRDGLESRFHSTSPHLLFVACDIRRRRPCELLKIASRAGYHARLVA